MLQLYNSLTRRLEPFEPAGETVTLYVCGITPYDTTHLGHAFTYASADVLIRYLEHCGYQVIYVQNVTDIDDDILRKAAEVGENWRLLGDRWTAHFIEDMLALNVRPPDYLPRASDAMVEIIEGVENLLRAGVAYEAGGSVYFNIEAWPEYGKLSRIPREEMLAVANERGNHPEDPNKRDPLDFILWQAQAPGEPAWESPWGPGRPGWHIECSSLVTRFLGETIDIHAGGSDLIFPHHESEIAQVEPVTGVRPFVRNWLHSAMVSNEGQKMSKSLGNLVMVRDLLETWSADALRLYLASYHYREEWTHDLEQLEIAQRKLESYRQALSAPNGKGQRLEHAPLGEAFIQAMDQDLDTPLALETLLELADRVARAAERGRDVAEAQAVLREMGRILGLRVDSSDPECRVQRGWGDHLRRFRPSEEALDLEN